MQFGQKWPSNFVYLSLGKANSHIDENGIETDIYDENSHNFYDYYK